MGIDLFFVVVEGSANQFATVQGNLVPLIFFYIFLVVFSMASIAI